MNLRQLLMRMKNDPGFMANVTSWTEIPARPARYAPFPEALDERLRQALESRGIRQLYTHQRQALDAVAAGRDAVVVTPTASGKTLCYNLPVLQRILAEPEARALYLFPTKALAADQVAELHELVEKMGVDIKTFTYDGDTAVSARKAVRQAGHVVVTNPDMLHSGILPGHTKWVKLFENLRFVVIDEIHTYRGVFGSHMAHVIERLKRICAFYGSHPQFICCSATIANPKQLAEGITGREMTLVDDNGAPAGEKHIVFYNPPVVNQQLGIRAGSIPAARNIATELIQNGIQTIVFGKSRLTVEVLVSYLKQLVRDPLGATGKVRGYRGGYLPNERRQIERGLRSGEIQAVVSTNALELGIDIGSLQACVLCGYPGTIASTWQEAGRAGRRNETSVIFLVASSGPMDQYVVQHPDFFFGQSPEHARINPDNLYILMSHFKCAAFELPFVDGESYRDPATTGEVLSFLEEQRIVRHAGGRWHWSAEEFPASDISLRSASNENVLIIDITHPDPRVIGEIDRFAAPTMVHEQAIYIHEGRQYQVEKLDLPNNKAYIRHVNVDYYTDADSQVNLKVLDQLEEQGNRFWGEVMVTTMVTMFKKIKFDTHETLGFGPVDLPETEMHTSAWWGTLPQPEVERWKRDELQNALVGVGNVLGRLAPLFMMCDPRDIAVVCQVKSPFTQQPTIFLYDTVAGGVGLSDKMLSMGDELLDRARQAIAECPCEEGCPACVGPAVAGPGVKQAAMRLIDLLKEG